MRLRLTILVFLSYVSIYSQTTIFTDVGDSYNNIDITVVDNYGPVDISNCTSVRFSMDFSFSEPWMGFGNMDSSDECPFGIPPCAGNPAMPNTGGCNSCWDFMFIEVLFDGSLVYSELIGGAGETRQIGTLSWIGCTNNAANATIRISNQNWAGDETNTFTNIVLECWDANPTAADNSPICQGDVLTLTGTISVPGDASSWIWTGMGTGMIVSPSSLITMVNNVSNGDIYTLTVTDDNNCTASDQVTAVVNPLQDATITFNDFCAGTPNGPTGIITPGGTFSFNPNPGGGVTINPVTGVISNEVGGATYTVQYTTPGPCSGMFLEMVSILPQEIATFNFLDFCVGSPNGPSGIISPGGVFTFNPIPGDGASINSSTGIITNPVGGSMYTIQYVTPGVCPGTHIEVVMVTNNITPSLGAFGPYCTSTAPVALPTVQNGISGNWSGPGIVGNQFSPVVAGVGIHSVLFTPNAGQCANTNTTSIEVIANPTGNLSGAPILCPGQCGEVMFNFSGGSGTFNINLNVSAGFFNLNIPVPGVTNSTVLTLCLSNGIPFDPATNTVNIPTFVPPGNYSLTLFLIFIISLFSTMSSNS
ncbi:MAG: hypothetical protein H7X99_02885 [Saprospiraceae bacterium]|nr:hypothetical protein [Saprospiraceae bacterium]